MVSSGDRSAKIRTYNYPQGRVTDHRINLTLYDLQNIVNGDIDKLVEELKIVQDSELIKMKKYKMDLIQLEQNIISKKLFYV